MGTNKPCRWWRGGHCWHRDGDDYSRPVTCPATNTYCGYNETVYDEKCCKCGAKRTEKWDGGW